MYKKIYTNIKNFFFNELVSSLLPLLKKHIRLGYTGIVDHSVDLSVPNLKKKYIIHKGEWTEAIKKKKI